MRPELDGVSDGELLARAVAGEDAPFAKLMARHEDRIFQLAYRMLGDRGDALDATQEAFISAFRQGRTFRGESAFSTWLYRIAINACNDLLRKRKRWRQETPPLEAVPEPRAETDVDAQAVARVDVVRALALLPEEYREAVVMHDLGGVPYEEIARITQTSIGTVKSRISRGRRRLGEILEQQTGPSPSKSVT